MLLIKSSNAPEHAKADLKRQMTQQDVRRTIVSFVVGQLGLRNSADVDLNASIASMPPPASESFHTDTTLVESTYSEPPPSQDSAPLDPLYLHTQRELEEAFREMQPAFDGKETEHNWMARDKCVHKIRRLLQGNAPSDFHGVFVGTIRQMQENILKVANTLRTTMSTNGCLLVQELYRTFGNAMDPMTEIFMQNFIKMSAATKHIAANNANSTLETILAYGSYSNRLMQHVWLSFQEKNVQTRSFAPGWLKVLMKKNASHKSHIEHGGGIDTVEKCLKKGLEDANPKVRESTRAAFWTYSLIWPNRSEKYVLQTFCSFQVSYVLQIHAFS